MTRGENTRNSKVLLNCFYWTIVPTIQEKLAANGSPRATFDTTEDRLTFLIHIPVHAGSEATTETATETTTETTTETATEKSGSTTEKNIRLMRENPYITNKELADVCKCNPSSQEHHTQRHQQEMVEDWDKWRVELTRSGFVRAKVAKESRSHNRKGLAGGILKR